VFVVFLDCLSVLLGGGVDGLSGLGGAHLAAAGVERHGKR
jgi:hypothetical protein